MIESLRREPVEASRLEQRIGEALDPHLCRCTGYVRYYEAVKDIVVSTPGLVR